MSPLCSDAQSSGNRSYCLAFVYKNALAIWLVDNRMKRIMLYFASRPSVLS